MIDIPYVNELEKAEEAIRVALLDAGLNADELPKAVVVLAAKWAADSIKAANNNLPQALLNSNAGRRVLHASLTEYLASPAKDFIGLARATVMLGLGSKATGWQLMRESYAKGEAEQAAGIANSRWGHEAAKQSR